MAPTVVTARAHKVLTFYSYWVLNPLLQQDVLPGCSLLPDFTKSAIICSTKNKTSADSHLVISKQKHGCICSGCDDRRCIYSPAADCLIAVKWLVVHCVINIP